MNKTNLTRPGATNPKNVRKIFYVIKPVEQSIEVKGLVGNQCRFEVVIDATGRRTAAPIRCVITAKEGCLEIIGHEIVSVDGLPEPPPVETLEPEFLFGPGHRLVIADATNRLLHGKPFPVPLEEAIPLLETIQTHMP